MNTLTVALLQLLPAGSMDGNLEKGENACRRAKAMGADIALFPEMWLTGYSFPPEGASAEELRAWEGQAAPADGPFVRHFSRLARELDMAIGITLLEQYHPRPRNTLCLLDRQGRRVLTYAKAHTCDFGDEKLLTPGDAFPVAELDTAAGPVRVGAMICYDREFPESARLLMLAGAELILVPNACPMEPNRLAQLKARAFENMVGIAMANYPYGQPDCNGHSSAFDGVAYRPGGSGPRDTLVLEAGESEGIYPAVFDLEQLRAYRAQEVHGDAYRRPGLYGPLLSREVAPPFVRPDARR